MSNSLQLWTVACHGILQARTLQWVAMPSSRGSSRPRDRTQVSRLLHWQAGSLPLVPSGKTFLKISDAKSQMCLSFYNNYTSNCFFRQIWLFELSKTDAIVFVVLLEFSFSVIFTHPSSCRRLCEFTTFTFQLILSSAHFPPDYCGLLLPPQSLAPTDSGSDS